VSYGTELGLLVRSHLRHQLAHGNPFMYAELPLGEPGVAHAVEALEELGFSYAGLVPEIADGDILRLHYVSQVDLDMKIEVITEWGAEIREYVLAQAAPNMATSLEAR
jgi:serine/threonine-protein kinase RsbW